MWPLIAGATATRERTMGFASIRSDVERVALRKRVTEGLYPEYADYLMELQMAIVLGACGQFTRAVHIDGEDQVAELLVAALDLEDFVYRRQLASWN
jgi:hypothetical protein